MRRPGYREAIEWMVLNDDTSWAENSSDTAEGSLSVTGALVRDLFGVGEDKLRSDLRACMIRFHSKAEPAAPFDGKPTWHGMYCYGGCWQRVVNRGGKVIAYASADAAARGARLQLTDAFAEAGE